MKFNLIRDDALSKRFTWSLIFLFFLTLEAAYNDDDLGSIVGLLIFFITAVVVEKRVKSTKTVWVILLISNTLILIYAIIMFHNIDEVYLSVSISSLIVDIIVIVMSVLTYIELFKRNTRAVYGIYI